MRDSVGGQEGERASAKCAKVAVGRLVSACGSSARLGAVREARARSAYEKREVHLGTLVPETRVRPHGAPVR